MRWMWTAVLMAALGASAAELTVMSTGAVKTAFTDATSQWSKDTGHKVNATFDPAGPLRQKIASGVRGDIVIIPVESLAALEKEGIIVAGSRRDLGAVSMGAAVKEGAPIPDISTVEALKGTLRDFDTVILPKLGMRDEVRAKTKLGEGGSTAEKVASGEAQIAFQNVTELMGVKGARVVGLIPAELQSPIVYAGAVMKDAKHPAEAQQLLDYLSSPPGRKAFLDKGFASP
jgi:molybdate transport system substrate-binding protein